MPRSISEAVCGPRADIALLERICPEARPALHECLGAGVLVADGNLIRFRHELARRATQAQIPDFDRIELHRRALTALAAPPADPNALAAIAFHADEAGDNDAAVHQGVAAAQQAAALGASRRRGDLGQARRAEPHSSGRPRAAAPGRLAGGVVVRPLRRWRFR